MQELPTEEAALRKTEIMNTVNQQMALHRRRSNRTSSSAAPATVLDIGKSKVPHWSRNNPQHQQRLGGNCIGRYLLQTKEDMEPESSWKWHDEKDDRIQWTQFGT